MTQQQPKQPWIPPEVLEAQRQERVYKLQGILLEAIRQHPIPPDEAVAALSNASLWLLAMNATSPEVADRVLTDIRKAQRKNIFSTWKTCQQLKKLAAERQNDARSKEEDRQEADGNSSESTPEDVR